MRSRDDYDDDDDDDDDKEDDFNYPVPCQKNAPKRKVVIGDAVPQTLTEGSVWTAEHGSAFDDVKSAFIVETQNKYAAVLCATYRIAASGGKNGLTVNCFSDQKANREKCGCEFGLRATWVRFFPCNIV